MKLSFPSATCYTLVRYSLFKFARRIGKRYKYEKEGYYLYSSEIGSGEIEFVIEANNSSDFLGYATYHIYNSNQLEFSLNVDLKDTDSGKDYRGKEILKGIYDLLIKKYSPNTFKSMYISDNYMVFMRYYTDSSNLKFAFNNTPSGKVLVKRAFEVDLSKTIIPQNRALVQTSWNKLKCSYGFY